MESLLVQREGPLGWLTFNRPERRNAITYEMWLGIARVIGQLNADPAVRVILLRGAGEEAFVAGADISEFKDLRHDVSSGAEYTAATAAAFRALRESEKPVVAMIRGYCIGGGCAIALNCDLRVAAEDARFAIPAAKLGVGYGYENVQQVVHVVGPAFAREILYTARTYDAGEALRMGLIHQRVSVVDLERYTRSYAEGIAANAPLSVCSTKMAIDEYLRPSAERDLARIQAAMDRCFESDDYREGYTAFLEKRPPRFRGC